MRLHHVIAVAALALAATSAARGGIWHVDDDAAGANDGLTWQDAFTDLQDALDAAEADDEIWVAAGTYVPSIRSNPDEPRSATFLLPSRVLIYGGFAGGESTVDERDFVANETMLSGDLVGDDELVFNGDQITIANVHDNTFHVVTGTNALLDGVTIIGGNADWWEGDERLGGGLFSIGGGMRVRNTMFVGNQALYGGAVYTLAGAPRFVNCDFLWNKATLWASHGDGGAIYNMDGMVVVSECTFIGNRTSPEFSQDGGGGAIWGGPLRIRRSHFENNWSVGGGAIAADEVTMTDCTFVANRAIWDGSGGAFRGGGLTAIRCEFVSNDGDDVAGALGLGGTSTLVNCRFVDNSGEFHSGAIANGGTLTAIGCELSGNGAPGFNAGGAIHNYGAATLVNCTLASTSTYVVGNVGSGSLTIANSIVWGDTDESILDDAGTADVRYSIVRGGYPGQGNLDVDPQCVDLGAHDLRLVPGSPAIDAGDNATLLDLILAMSPQVRVEIGRGPRFYDDPATADTGVSVGGEPVVDIGAREHTTPGDFDLDGIVDTFDLLRLFGAWGDCEGCPEDVNGDGVVDTVDLLMLFGNWS